MKPDRGHIGRLGHLRNSDESSSSLVERQGRSPVRSWFDSNLDYKYRGMEQW